MARNKYPEETVARILDAAQRLFIEKGYEHTTIQDIVNELGDLTKGAIYHHFKSKEDILIAVGQRVFQDMEAVMNEAAAKTYQSGLERLQAQLRTSLFYPGQEHSHRASPNLLKNPHMLATLMENNQEWAAPSTILPAVEQMIAEGTIHTEYPLEYCEAVIILMNIWLSPMLYSCSSEAFARRVACFRELTRLWGADILDDELAAQFNRFKQLSMEGQADREKAGET